MAYLPRDLISGAQKNGEPNWKRRYLPKIALMISILVDEGLQTNDSCQLCKQYLWTKLLEISSLQQAPYQKS
jgi:hypothetical protein